MTVTQYTWPSQVPWDILFDAYLSGENGSLRSCPLIFQRAAAELIAKGGLLGPLHILGGGGGGAITFRVYTQPLDFKEICLLKVKTAVNVDFAPRLDPLYFLGDPLPPLIWLYGHVWAALFEEKRTFFFPEMDERKCCQKLKEWLQLK
jgi:hypothetical protein